MTNTQECPCDCGGMCVLNADLDAAEAKVKQLKQVLEKIRDNCWPVIGDRPEWAREIARSALEEVERK